MTHFYMIEHLKRAEGLQILHPQFETAIERLRHAHQLSREGAAARNLLLVGPSGIGKTTVLEAFCTEFPAVQTAEYLHCPILYVRVPATPTIRNLAEEMLIALGAGIQMRGSSTEKTSQLKILLRNCRTEFLILDEFHHFLKQGKRSVEDVTEWLKTLIDAIQIPVVLAGLPQAEEILQANEQLRRRFAAHISLTPFSLDSDEDKELFRSVLHAVDLHINQDHSLWGLADWDRVRRMYYASNGLIGYVSKIVFGALEIMIDQQRTRFQDWMLETAFTKYVWDRGREKNNPFNSKFVFRRLDQRDEPFELTSFSRPTPPRMIVL
ncbi:TniB family NTP-binding protein [Chromobacterium piscinae]|uniref:TniB family NTP-binding protein n=1 Tax=Chromobacterium piscinae TaxID=686831 RepID=UPI003F806203